MSILNGPGEAAVYDREVGAGEGVTIHEGKLRISDHI